MSTPDDLHTPTPAFVAGLEEAVLRAYREADAIPVIPRTPSTRWRDWGRIAAVLVLGAALGVGGQFASAQVRDAKTRSELERSLAAEREMRLFQLGVANAEVQQVRGGVAMGAVSAQTAFAAITAQHEAERALARIDLDLAEVRLTNAQPRNDLGAPKVANRDFVMERLRVEASYLVERMGRAEQKAAVIEERWKSGLELQGALADAQAELADRRRDLKLTMAKVKLRDQFLSGAIKPAEMTRELQATTMEAEFERAFQLVQVSRSRLTTVQERYKVGLSVALDVKRAELDLMERELMLKRMQVEVQRAVRKEEQ